MLRVSTDDVLKSLRWNPDTVDVYNFFSVLLQAQLIEPWSSFEQIKFLNKWHVVVWSPSQFELETTFNMSSAFRH